MSDPNSDALPLGYTPIVKSWDTKYPLNFCFWYLVPLYSAYPLEKKRVVCLARDKVVRCMPCKECALNTEEDFNKLLSMLIVSFKVGRRF